MPGKREEKTHLERREVGLRRVRQRDEIGGGNGGRSKFTHQYEEVVMHCNLAIRRYICFSF
jgi:hypothetical protein